MSNSSQMIDEQPSVGETLKQLMQRAEQGDLTTLPQVRAYLDRHPEIWRQYGDLGYQAESAWVSLAAGSDVVLAESIRRKLEELKADIGGPATSPLEKLLVEQVVLAWLESHFWTNIVARNAANNPNLQLVSRDYLQRCQDRAQRRLLQAVKSLALVRKLITPATKTEAEQTPADVSATTPQAKGDFRTSMPAGRAGDTAERNGKQTGRGRKAALPRPVGGRMDRLPVSC